MKYSGFNKYLKTFEEKQGQRETEGKKDCLQRDRTIKRQTNRKMVSQKDRQTERQKDKKTDRQKDKKT